jgi:hypothetical protein
VDPPTVWLVAGLLILALTTADLFLTVLHHWGGAGPLTGLVTRTLWRGAVLATTHVRPALRLRLLSLVGPAMIPCMAMIWSGLSILGFAALYAWRDPAEYAAAAGTPPLTSFADAVYFSGVTFFTLGFGDLVPLTTGIRVLSFVQAGSGFALMTLVISYFVSVYQGYTAQNAAAETLYYQAGRSADVAVLLVHHLARPEGSVQLFAEASRLRDLLSRVRADHRQYPLLHYFVARRVDGSMIRLLFMSRELVTLMDLLPDPQRFEGLSKAAVRSGLKPAVEELQTELLKTLGLDETRTRPDPQLQQAWRERFQRARETLAENGVAAAPQRMAERYVAARAEWDPALRRCAAALGQPWEEVSGGF